MVGWRLCESCIRWRLMQAKSAGSVVPCALVYPASVSVVAAVAVRQEVGA